MYEKLKNLLVEWKKYSNPDEQMPGRIRRNELWSIGKSIELTLAEMRGTDEYQEITEEEWENIKHIFNFLVSDAILY